MRCRITAAANAAVRKALPFGDTQDFDDVGRGLIAPLPDGGDQERRRAGGVGPVEVQLRARQGRALSENLFAGTAMARRTSYFAQCAAAGPD